MEPVRIWGCFLELHWRLRLGPSVRGDSGSAAERQRMRCLEDRVTDLRQWTRGSGEAIQPGERSRIT